MGCKIADHYFRQNSNVIGNICKWSFAYSDVAHTHLPGEHVNAAFSYIVYERVCITTSNTIFHSWSLRFRGEMDLIMLPTPEYTWNVIAT
jgi:hypothetical protein